MEELNDSGFVFVGVSGVAQTMPCIREGIQTAGGSAERRNFVAHIAGNKPIILTMEKQHWNFGALNRFFCTAFIQIKMTKNLCAKPDEGI